MDCRLKAGWAVTVCLALSATAGIAGERVEMVNEGGIRDRWTLADGIKLTAPGYPAAFSERGDNVCVAMGYAINPDGTTSDFGVLKAWNSATGEEEPVAGFWEAFSQASAGALSQWKFKPRPEVTDPKTVYTVATMSFMGKQATDAAGLRSNCAISDLTSFVQKQKWDKTQVGSLEKNALQSYRRSQMGGRTMVERPAAAQPPKR